MALIKCYECGKKISDLAEFCPHCGAPNQTKEQEKTTYVSNLSLLWNRKLIRKIKWKSPYGNGTAALKSFNIIKNLIKNNESKYY